MLKIDRDALDHMDTNYPGIRKQILRYEVARFPVCPHCGSWDTAEVNVGITGRTINIASATNRFKLIANGPKPGEHFCNACEKFYG